MQQRIRDPIIYVKRGKTTPPNDQKKQEPMRYTLSRLSEAKKDNKPKLNLDHPKQGGGTNRVSILLRISHVGEYVKGVVIPAEEKEEKVRVEVRN